MSNAIYIENKKFISQWIALNPNFKGLEFKNNILKYGEDEIDLKIFLVSELLNNEYFINNIYTMKINEFLKIIDLHVKSISILNPKEDKNADETEEYIKHIKINSLKRAVVITDKEEIEILNIDASDVLKKYSLLLLNYNYYVPLNELLRLLNKEEKNKNPIMTSNIFFQLLQKDGELSAPEIDYIKSISNFIFKLNDNEHVLVDKAKNLLDSYIFEMNKLKQIDKLTSAQKYALKLFNNYIEILEAENKKNEEYRSLNSSQNYGYSSLILIITSVITTGLVLLFFMICN